MVQIPNMNPASTSQMSQPRRESSSAGPVVGIIIVIVLLALGALYFWGASMNRQQEPVPFIPEDNSTAPTG